MRVIHARHQQLLSLTFNLAEQYLTTLIAKYRGHTLLATMNGTVAGISEKKLARSLFCVSDNQTIKVDLSAAANRQFAVCDYRYRAADAGYSPTSGVVPLASTKDGRKRQIHNN